MREMVGVGGGCGVGNRPKKSHEYVCALKIEKASHGSAIFQQHAWLLKRGWCLADFYCYANVILYNDTAEVSIRYEVIISGLVRQ